MKVAYALHEANVWQHFSNNLDSPIPNRFVLGYKSLEEVTEHSGHEAVSNGIFILVPAFSPDLLIGCWSARLVDVRVQVKHERTLFNQDFDISSQELSDAICDNLPLLDQQNATHHVANRFLKESFSNELLPIAAAG
jgi:hypothetical protein